MGKEIYNTVCIEEDCYNEMDENDIERGIDEHVYERSKKCWDCRTDADRKAIKAFRKRVHSQQRKCINPNH